jgi:glycosyltransferase involved in cell wall biosynthesis
MPRISIFIPTYNRGYILGRALESLEHSTNRDFEALVIDDGSTDDTTELVARWKSKARFPIIYEKQANQGKHVAHNTAIGLANGELFLNLDSDDQLLPDALDLIIEKWDNISASDKPGFAGIMGLCVLHGKLYGTPYPQDVIDSDFLAIRTLCHVSGEKRAALRTDVLLNYPYPTFPGERYCRPSLIYERLAHHYRTRFSNIRLIDVGHQPDGICANRRRILVNNPRAYRQFFLEKITDHADYLVPGEKVSTYARYIRHSLNAKVPLSEQAAEVRSRRIWIMALPKGILGWLRDQIRISFWRS